MDNRYTTDTGRIVRHGDFQFSDFLYCSQMRPAVTKALIQAPGYTYLPELAEAPKVKVGVQVTYRLTMKLYAGPAGGARRTTTVMSQ